MRDEAAYRRELRRRKAANRPLVKCAGCPVAFRPARADQRYHSHACKQKAYRLRVDRPTVTDGRSPVTVGVEG